MSYLRMQASFSMLLIMINKTPESAGMTFISSQITHFAKA